MADKNYLDMSDEDFLREGMNEEPAQENTSEPEITPVDPEPTTPTDEPNGDPEGNNEPEGEGSEPSAPSGSEGSGEGDEPNPEGGEDGEPPEAKPEGEVTPSGEAKPENTPKTEEPDYKAAYDALFTNPIKANGKDIKISSVEDAKRLIQMGANYNKQMANLKPMRKVMKSLEAVGLMDQEKIDYLIDLHLKKPEAIAKLVADSKIDPLDLSTDKASNYKPTSYAVSDKQFALDETFDDLQSSPGYVPTLELVSQKWDAASRQKIADQPQLFRYLTGHMESGVGELVLQEIDRQEMLGSLSGLTSLEKYKTVGDQLHTAGAFEHLATKPVVVKPQAGTVIQPKVVTPKVNDKLNSQRRAAAPSRSTPAKDISKVNPLSMSDEEFEKVSKELYGS